MNEITNSVQRLTARFREGTFDRDAAVEAIDAAIDDAAHARNNLASHMHWLRQLKDRHPDNQEAM